MNTTVSKSFGLALLLAVGILAVMVAMGTFSAQKAGAVADEVTTVTTDPSPASAGGAIELRIAISNDGTALDDFARVKIKLADFGLPASIDTRDVYIDTADGGGDNDGNPDGVTVSGDTITLRLNNTTDDGGASIGANGSATIIFWTEAGITAPATAGSYRIEVDGNEAPEDQAIVISASLAVDPGKGAGSTEITVTGKAFASGTGSLFSQAVIDPDYNEDGIFDAVIDTSPEGTDPTVGDGHYNVDVNGNNEPDYLIAESTTQDNDGYVAVAIGGSPGTNDEDAIGLGYEIGGDSTASAPDNIPTITRPEDDPERSRLKGVTADDGAFETTIDAADLKKRKMDGRSIITFRDSDGGEDTTVFTVTGTTTLGSDSVGKGKVLKISISDWIETLPTLVKIDGEDLAIVAKDGTTAYTVERDEDNADTFYVKVSGKVGLGNKTVVLFGNDDNDTPADTTDDTANGKRLDSAMVEVTAVGLTVSPSIALVGREVTVTGSGFAGKVMKIEIGGVTTCDGVEDCGIDVASGGRVVAAFPIPNDGKLADADDYTIMVTDDQDRIGTGTVTIPEPTLTVDPAESRIGSTINLSGAGWPTGTGANLVAIYYGDDRYATATTGSSGEWSASIDVPDAAEVGETNTITAKASVGETVDDEDNVTQEADHKTPDAVLTLSSGQAQRGTTITVSGHNFHTYRPVMIEIDGSPVTPAGTTTDGDGSFTADVLVPGISLGNKNLKVTVNKVPVVEFLEIVSTPVVTTKTVEEVFGDLIDNDSLTTVWRYDFDTRTWTSYTTDPETSFGNDLFELDSGDILYVHVSSDQSFSHQKGETLMMGWSLITLN